MLLAHAFARYCSCMPIPKRPIPPISPTVAAVFDAFLVKLEKDENIEKEVAAQIRDTLLKKGVLDPESLRLALFGYDL